MMARPLSDPGFVTLLLSPRDSETLHNHSGGRVWGAGDFIHVIPESGLSDCLFWKPRNTPVKLFIIRRKFT